MSLELPGGADRRSERLSDSPWPYYYVVTKTGYLDDNSYAEVMRAFADLWEQQHPGLWCYILADQLNCHKKPKIVEEMALRHIFTVLFAPNTLHFVQPLDGLVLATFKKVSRQVLSELGLDAALNDGPAGPFVFHAMYTACAKAFKSKIITKSFRDRGVWPFNRHHPDAMRKWINKRAKAPTGGTARQQAVQSLLEYSTSLSSERRASMSAQHTTVRATLKPLTPKTTWQIRAAAAATKKKKEDEKAAQAKKKQDREHALVEKAEAAAQKKAENSARQLASKAAMRIARTCRGGCGNARKTKSWLACACKKYFLYPGCASNPVKRSAFSRHARKCDS